MATRPGSRDLAYANLERYLPSTKASDFERAQTRYNNNQSILASIGEAGKKTLGMLSFALAPLDYLGGIVRAGAFSLANLNPANEDIDINRNEVEDDGNFFTNMRRAILKNPFDPTQRVAGFGDVPEFQFSDDDSLLTRLGKATIGFTGDVLTDPTTYLSFGVAPIAKKLAAKSVAPVTIKRSAEILGSEIAEDALTKAATEGAEKAANELFETEARNILRGKATDRILRRNLDIENLADASALSVDDYIRQMDPADRLRFATEQIGDEATAVFRGGGRNELRTYFNTLAKETGIDDFRTLYDAQSPAIRGGIAITNPLGKPIKQLTPGGVSPLSPLFSKAGTKLGASKVGQALTSGADRELAKVAKMSAADIAQPGGLARAAQSEKALRLSREAAAEQRKLVREMGQEAKTVMFVFQRMGAVYDDQIDEAGQSLGNRFRREVNDWYNRFDEEGAAQWLGKDIEAIAVPLELTDEVSANAFRTARAMRDFMYNNYVRLGRELGEDFVPEGVGVVQGALRKVSEDGRRLYQNLFGVSAGQPGSAGYKARKSFIVTDEDGKFVRFMTLREANESQRANLRQYLDEAIESGKFTPDSPQVARLREEIEAVDWFDTDLPTIFSREVNKLERQVHRATAVRLMKRSGLLIETQTEKAVSPSRIVKSALEEIDRLEREAQDIGQRIPMLRRATSGLPTGETWEEGARVVQRQREAGVPEELVQDTENLVLDIASDEGSVSRIVKRSEEQIDKVYEQVRERLSDAENLRAAVRALGDTTGEEQADEFAALLDTMINLKEEQANRLARTVGKTEAYKEAKAAAELLVQARRRDASQVINLIGRAEPMLRLGTVVDKRGRVIDIERQFSSLWSPQLVAEALSRTYRLTNETRSKVEDVFRSTTGLWKQWATFGRGPAFVFRNIGGWWNAFLVGANANDMRQGLRYATQYELALQDFRKAVKNTNNITQAKDLLERTLEKRMGKVKNFMGFEDMYQAHRWMESEGIFGGTITSAAMDIDSYTNIPKLVTQSDVVGRGTQDVVSSASFDAVEPVAGRVARGELSVAEAVREIRKDPKLLQRAASSTVNNPWMYVMRAFSEDSERFLRAATFSAGVRQYGSDRVGSEMATLLTKASQFDYTDLSPSEQRVMKLVSPFFVWTKNNVPFQFRNLFANPGKVNAILKLQENVEKQFGDENEDLTQYMPQWLQEQLGFASVLGSGQNQLAMSLNLPLSDLNRFFEVPVTESGNLDIARNPLGLLGTAARVAVSGARDDALGSANPFLKTLVESTTGVNLFTGAKFSEQTPGPAYSALSVLPGIPDVYVDPETGQRQVSGFALNQVRNLLPQVGQLDRLLPFGQQGSAKERLLGNWISQGLSFLPITVSATLTQSQYAGELRTRNLKLEEQIRQYERDNGLIEGSLRERYNERQKMLSSQSRNRALAAALAP